MSNRILVLTDYYLPGFKGGGPIRSLSNMVDSLYTSFEFSIVTRNHDLKSDKSYDEINSGEWIFYKNSRIFYLKSNFFRIKKLFNILSKGNYDIIYLNSFFSFYFSIIPLIYWLLFFQKKKIILAPRGEFSKNALEISWLKKWFYINIFRHLKIYNLIHWQASSNLEAHDIVNCFPKLNINKITIASDLLIYPNIKIDTDDSLKSIDEESQCLNLVFISRIAEIKNIDFIIKLLKNIKSKLHLSIYGPIEDENYWNYCLKIMEELGNNVDIKYCGEINHDKIYEVFSKYDLFVFPTKGENFGHVVFESLASGTSVLLSDKTPWQSDENLAIDIVPLDRPEIWQEKIEKWINYNNETKLYKRKNAKRFSKVVYDNDINVIANLELFNQFKN